MSDQLGDRIARHREMRGMNKRQLAQAADVPEKQVYLLESGKTRHPRPATLDKIAAALGIDPVALRGELDADRIAVVERRLDDVAARLDAIEARLSGDALLDPVRAEVRAIIAELPGAEGADEGAPPTRAPAPGRRRAAR